MTKIILPPPFVEKFQYKDCVQVNNPETKRRSYLTPDGESLPSVTTILSATKDMTALNKWKDRVGHDAAAKIAKDASSVGTCMHENLERFVCGIERKPGNNPIHVKANAMADKIIEHGLRNIDEIWTIEQSLYYSGLYAGSTDGVGTYYGNPTIFDYKQTNKVKTNPKYVEDYFLQLCAYALAHNFLHGTDIREGHIFMCSRGDDPLEVGGEIYQQFDLWPNDFDRYTDMWLERVESYYKLHG
jgi:genome maintenance exonuclease 1